MIEAQLLQYKQYISIKNMRSNRYMALDIKSQRLFANGSHPFLHINEIPLEMSTRVFQIINSQNVDYNGPLIYGSQIMIQIMGPSSGNGNSNSVINNIANNGSFLICQPGGDVRIERYNMSEVNGIKNARFQILDPNNFQSKRQVGIYDDIILKFNETNYLISELNQVIDWNGSQISIDSIWKFHKAQSPPMPDWIYLRPYISLSYLSPLHDALIPSNQINNQQQYLMKQDERRTLGSYPASAQQLYLIEDLLFCMMGIEGTYIRRKSVGNDQKLNGQFEYAIEPNLDQVTCEISLQQMVMKILPLCAQHDQVQFYVQNKSRYEYGLISQALCSGIRVLLKEYLTMINQLDAEFNNGELTLQKLWYYLQPSIKVMGALATLAENTITLTGGILLNQLFELINQSTDRQIIIVYEYLAERGSQPYIEMMSKWLYEGEIIDVYNEFLVHETKSQSKNQLNSEYRDTYWETRFKLRTTQTPKFLEKLKDVVLRTGKYLNVVRETKNITAIQPDRQLDQQIDQIIKSQDFSVVSLKAFDYANKQILDLLFHSEDLMGRLRTIKRFFMMESGDFFIQFLELAEDELIKSTKIISKEKVESLLDMSVRSVSCTDAYKEDIIGYLDQYTVMEQIYALHNHRGSDNILNVDILRGNTNQTNNITHNSSSSLRGIDLFTIDLRINWPVNLVLSRTSMVKYQIIFKSLFFFKYVERQLNKTWMLHQTVKEFGLQDLFNKSHILLQQMLHFMKSYLFYFSYDVIEQNYTILENKLTQLETFEEVLTNHNNFIDTCLSQSLLLDASWMKGFNSLTQCCLTFAKAMQRFTTTLTRSDPQIGYQNWSNNQDEFPSELNRRKYWIKQTSEHVKQIITEQSYNNTVNSFQKKFNDNSKDLIKMIYQKIQSQNNYLTGLITRLDFDGHFAGIQSISFQPIQITGQQQFYKLS